MRDKGRSQRMKRQKILEGTLQIIAYLKSAGSDDMRSAYSEIGT